MKTYTVSMLAQAFGLSRTALLYYDRIGLLPPAGRTNSGYRYYTGEGYRRLERICSFRQAGLALEDIRMLLSSEGEPRARILEERLRKIGDQILDLRNQQRLLSGMLKSMAAGGCPPTVDKSMWVDMLRAAGMDEQAMACWHQEFERRAPAAHHEFLSSLGISEREIHQIRKWSKKQH